MIKENYNLWLKKAILDKDLIAELKEIENDNDAISDRFYKSLEFGTGGLRGEIGAGTNRMNVYTVAKATQGLAEYVLSVNKTPSVAIAYDSRIKSDVFAKCAAEVLAANGVKVFIYKELMPTPMLSFAVRQLSCDAGIVITASHNPAKYNGYKAYGPDGCQLNLEASNYVLSIMNKVDIFDGVKRTDFGEAVNNGLINYIEDDVINAYLNEVQKMSVTKNLDFSNFKVIYTPLHGTGNKPVRAILKRIGIENILVIKEQELPDGNFPTAPYPNPEIKQPFEIALERAKTYNPDILLATDPDCDRVGIAVKHGEDYQFMTGNEVGALLLNYILEGRKAANTLPQNPVAVKTIVTTDICEKIARDYGCRLINVLTGFKFIGEQIAILEKDGEENRYVLGFEESYGYLAGSYVRDKDAVVAAMLICEMAAYYKKQGFDLVQMLENLYEKHGYYFASQKSYTYEGESGMNKISAIMDNFRTNPPKNFAGKTIIRIDDYKTSESRDLINGATEKIDLPKSNVICFVLDGGSSFIARPSGTEPKIKFYLSAVNTTEEATKETLTELLNSCDAFVN